jgi:hypothetical protein
VRTGPRTAPTTVDTSSEWIEKGSPEAANTMSLGYLTPACAGVLVAINRTNWREAKKSGFLGCPGRCGWCMSESGLGCAKTRSDLVVMPCGKTNVRALVLSASPEASKLRVRAYRTEFSHSLGPFLPSSSSGRHGSYPRLSRHAGVPLGCLGIASQRRAQRRRSDASQLQEIHC